MRALDNLGATQYQLGDLIAAERAYQRALAVVEQRQGASSLQLVAPLRGLALTEQGRGRDDLAVPLFERAVAIRRRSGGLFDPAQHELLEALVEGYTALGRYPDADREQQYLLRVAEHQYGDHDRRLFPALERLAQWSERRRRHTEARQLWLRMLQIANQKGQVSFYGIITSLRGISRSYRLDYLFGPEPPPASAFPHDVQIPRTDALDRDSLAKGDPARGGYFLDPRGREALDEALKFARAVKPPREDALFVLLIELGDWHLLAENAERAMPFYRQALPYMPPTAGTPEQPLDPLAYPAQLLYRPPLAALRHREQPATTVTETVAIAEFTVGADGHCRDVKIVEGDASEGHRTSLSNAIGRAIYRPRFVDGQPVATEKIRYRESFRELNH